MGDERCRDHRAGAGPIFDDDRLPKPLADALGRKSGYQVIRTVLARTRRPSGSDGPAIPDAPTAERTYRQEGNGKNYGPIIIILSSIGAKFRDCLEEI